jgi:alkylated DNA repair protein alkB homolog 1
MPGVLVRSIHKVEVDRQFSALWLHQMPSNQLLGLYIIPSLIPLGAQYDLLSRLLHRDLSNPQHLTNIHMHYDVTYPPDTSSFFALPLNSEPPCSPKDSSVHSPISVQSLLDRKLRWMTLGGQYDWTMKLYPSTPPPPFPRDIAEMLHRLFPDMQAEAAICNLYTPGDTLSLHRDVSEFCDAPLVSISIGCDAIFVVKPSHQEDGGNAESKKPLVVRLHSGDALYMSGSSRFAWHGVPQVIPETCPEVLADWPSSPLRGVEADPDAEEDVYEHWRGWMRRKRINLNVRQMKA